MEIKRTALRESVTALKITAVFAVLVSVVLAIIGHFSIQTAGGIITGAFTGTANYFLLAVSVARICADSGMTAAEAKTAMKKSYALRMLMMFALSAAAIAFLKVNPLTHALFMLLPCISPRHWAA